jgi:hypothetical protein
MVSNLAIKKISNLDKVVNIFTFNLLERHESLIHVFTCKANVPNLVTCLNQPSIVECFVVRCGSKNAHQKHVR